MTRHWFYTACVALLGLSLGCSGFAAPHERLSTAEAALRAASEVGAGEVPRASLHLKLSQEQIDEAKQLMADGRNEQADLALRRAQADAELAIMVAKEQKTLAEAQATEEKFQKLKAQAQR